MPWKPIVVGIDGTPESLRAAELAITIADAAGAVLVPVHAAPVLPVFTDMVGMEPMPLYSSELQDEVMQAAREQITRTLGGLLPPTAVQRLEVVSAPAPFVIAEAARQHDAELVVLGGKQHGALARGLGRSTAHYLVRTLDMPVLVVADSVTPIERVLAAIDLSGASEPTIRAARRLADLFSAELRLLHVVEPLRFNYIAPDQWNEEVYERHSRDAFERFVARFKEIPLEDRVTRLGVPSETIAEEARAWGAGVVVVGSHGKGWVDRILVGSTTQRLVTELPTAVLVVPTRLDRTAASRRETARPEQAAPVH